MEIFEGSLPYNPTYSQIGEKKRDNLVNGEFTQIRDNVKLAPKQGLLKRGSVLGQVTTSGEYKLVANDATDGSQNPLAILVESVDTDKPNSVDPYGVVYLTGEFCITEIHQAPGKEYSKDQIKRKLRPFSIFLSHSTPLRA